MRNENLNVDFWQRLIGKTIKLFLKNGFKYEGRLIAVCEDFIEIFDYKIQLNKILRIVDIADLEVLR